MKSLKLIPVTKKLPEVDQDIICLIGKNLVAAKYVMQNVLISREPYKTEMQGRFQTEKYPCEGDRSICTYWTNVTHWMPAKIEE